MFANKVVIVTGGSSGIGAATAELFAKEKASITIVGRNEAKLNNVAKKCDQLGAKVLIIKADVSKENETETIVKKTVEKFGKLDVLVNNAGIARNARVDDSKTLAVYDEVMNTNMRAVVQLTNLAAPYLKDTKGNIVNISSVAGKKVAFQGLSAYAVSKAAMDHFTKFAAFELASSGVRVNSISPGPVITDIFQTFDLPPTADGSALVPENLTVLGRMSEASEVADLVLYLASDKARSITGSSYDIDNGAMLK